MDVLIAGLGLGWEFFRSWRLDEVRGTRSGPAADFPDSLISVDEAEP